MKVLETASRRQMQVLIVHRRFRCAAFRTPRDDSLRQLNQCRGRRGKPSIGFTYVFPQLKNVEKRGALIYHALYIHAHRCFHPTSALAPVNNNHFISFR
jgi:hypothetical protein